MWAFWCGCCRSVAAVAVNASGVLLYSRCLGHVLDIRQKTKTMAIHGTSYSGGLMCLRTELSSIVLATTARRFWKCSCVPIKCIYFGNSFSICLQRTAVVRTKVYLTVSLAAVSTGTRDENKASRSCDRPIYRERVRRGTARQRRSLGSLCSK